MSDASTFLWCRALFPPQLLDSPSAHAVVELHRRNLSCGGGQVVSADCRCTRTTLAGTSDKGAHPDIDVFSSSTDRSSPAGQGWCPRCWSSKQQALSPPHSSCSWSPLSSRQAVSPMSSMSGTTAAFKFQNASGASWERRSTRFDNNRVNHAEPGCRGASKICIARGFEL